MTDEEKEEIKNNAEVVVPNENKTEPTPTSEIPIVFYCKDCRKTIKGEKVGAKYVYKCPDCKSENVAFGTPKSITNFYHLK